MTPDANLMTDRCSPPPGGPTVAAGMLRGLIDYAVSRGADRTGLLAAGEVAEADLADHDARLRMDRYEQVMAAAKLATGDPALALRYAEAVDMSQLSLVGLITHASETMMHAFLQLNRFGRLVVEVDGVGEGDRFSIVQRDGETWAVDNRARPNDFPELTETTFVRLAVGPRRFLPRPIVTAVQVTHPRPVHAAEYDRIFQVPVTFGADWNAVRLDMTLADHPVALLPRFAFGPLSDRAEALLHSLEGARTVRGRVEALLLPILHTGEVGVEQVAAGLGMSRQTLFRRLKAEGATFEAILDDLRRRLAIDYLSARKVSVNETAYLVGFSEAASFSRAFKRWTGRSPREVRYGQPA